MSQKYYDQDCKIRRFKPKNFPFLFFLFILILRGGVFLDINKFLIKSRVFKSFPYKGTDCLNISSFDYISEIRYLLILEADKVRWWMVGLFAFI